MPSTNKEVIAAYQNRYYLKNKNKILEYRKQHYNDNRKLRLQQIRENNYKRKYGLSFSEVLSRIEAQGFKCAICKSGFKNLRDQHLDHCHSSGKIRAVLCRSCNHGLGNFKDNVETMKMAIQYLEKYEKETT